VEIDSSGISTTEFNPRPVESGFREKLVSNQKKNVMFARSDEAIIGRVYDGDLLQNSLQEDCFYYSRLLPTEG